MPREALGTWSQCLGIIVVLLPELCTCAHKLKWICKWQALFAAWESWFIAFGFSSRLADPNKACHCKPTTLEDNVAGRKQHYLPQHLLRGFEASKAGKKIQVAVYKKGTSPYTTSTEGVAAQRDFYSPLGDGVIDTLDDVITAFESSTFFPFLNRARAAKPNECLDAEGAASAVVHLTVRAAYLRGSSAHLARKMVTELGEVLNNTKLVREFVDIDSASPKSLLSEEMQNIFNTLPFASLSSKERAIFERLARFKVREKFDEQMLVSAPVLRRLLSQLVDTLPTMVRHSHTKVLQMSLVPPARVEALKKLQWRVLAVESPNHFILPDCAAIASTSSGQLQPAAMSSNEEISWVAMPISARQVLVGYAGQVPPVLSDLNEHFAKCSLEFFVSSTLHDDLEVLAALIGEALEVMTYDLIEDSFSTAYPGSGEPVVQMSTINVRITPMGIELDADKTAAIGESIRKIFAQQCGTREEDRLESIVLTNDVVREVARLYGRALSPYEVAVTMAGTVVPLPDKASPVLQLILPESIGRLLLATDVCSGLIFPDTSIGGQSTIRGDFHDKAAPQFRSQL
ncbi:DUF4238 domain-containing protein [Alcaligenaceae bacterium]|nr:DUF4238 domain-containing protein [Alcaligenaceae bacterium]